MQGSGIFFDVFQLRFCQHFGSFVFYKMFTAVFHKKAGGYSKK
jgi:hypothetical protein